MVPPALTAETSTNVMHFHSVYSPYGPTRLSTHFTGLKVSGELEKFYVPQMMHFQSVDGPNAHFTVRTDRKLLLWTILDNPPGEGNKSAPGNDVDNREYSLFCFPFVSFVLERD